MVNASGMVTRFPPTEEKKKNKKKNKDVSMNLTECSFFIVLSNTSSSLNDVEITIQVSYE